MRQGNLSHVQLVDLQLFILVNRVQWENILFDFAFDFRLRRNLEFLTELFKSIQHRTKNRRG